MSPIGMEYLDLDGLAEGTRHDLFLRVADLPDGGALQIPVVVLAGSGVGPRLAAVAGIHGDEPEGMLALIDAAAKIAPERLRGRLIILPVANLPAFGAGRRESPLDGLDLNRTFPGRPDGRPSERLAHALFERIVRVVDFAFSLHSWYQTGTVLPYVEVPRSGEVKAACLAAARASGFDRVRELDWPAGLLVRVACETGIPAIEAEIDGQGTVTTAGRACYRRHLEALLRHLGMLNGPPQSPAASTLGEARHLLAPTGGGLRLAVGLGDRVGAGDPIGTITDVFGTARAEVNAPCAGMVLAHRTFASVSPGDNVCTLFSSLGSRPGRATP